MYQDEQSQSFIIPNFMGRVNQAIDESLLQPGRNFLMLKRMYMFVKGSLRRLQKGIQNTFLRLFLVACQTLMAFYKNNANGTVDKMLLASSPTNIYRWTGSQWLSIKSGLTGGRFSFINYQQGMTEITIMGNGTDPMLKWERCFYE